jgi:Anti-sigma-K factor rskA
MPPEADPTSSREPRRSAIFSWTCVVAAVLIAFAVYSAVGTWRAERNLVAVARRAQREQARSRALGSAQQRYQDALPVVADPATEKIDLAPVTNSATPPAAADSAGEQPHLAVYWNSSRGIVLAGGGLQPMPPGSALELWVQSREGNLVGALLSRPDAAGQLLTTVPLVSPMTDALVDAMRTPKMLAISQEPSGGNPFPTSDWKWTSKAH